MFLLDAEKLAVKIQNMNHLLILRSAKLKKKYVVCKEPWKLELSAHYKPHIITMKLFRGILRKYFLLFEFLGITTTFTALNHFTSGNFLNIKTCLYDAFKELFFEGVYTIACVQFLTLDTVL